MELVPQVSSIETEKSSLNYLHEVLTQSLIKVPQLLIYYLFEHISKLH